jgi:hypothetical protein
MAIIIVIIINAAAAGGGGGAAAVAAVGRLSQHNYSSPLAPICICIQWKDGSASILLYPFKIHLSWSCQVSFSKTKDSHLYC